MIDEVTETPETEEAVSSPEIEVKGLDAILSRAIEGAETKEAEPEPSKAERTRDEKGRFAPKTVAATPETAETAAPELQPTEAPDGTPDAGAVEESKALTPPEPQPEYSEGHFRGWSPELRAKFDGLPAEAKAVALEVSKNYQAQLTRASTEAAELRKVAEPVLSALQSEADIWAPQGLSPVEAVKAYANIERQLQYGNYADKVKLISQICDTYGVPFQPMQPENPYDPNAVGSQAYAAVHDQRALAAQEAAKRQQLEQRLERYERQQLETTIAQFQTATLPDGSPKHPHFEAVKPAMSALLQSGRAQTLEQAYELAAKPIEDLIAAKSLQARQSAEAQQRKSIEKAKKAAPVRVSPSTPNGKTKAKGLDAILSETLSEYGF